MKRQNRYQQELELKFTSCLYVCSAARGAQPRYTGMQLSDKKAYVV